MTGSLEVLQKRRTRYGKSWFKDMDRWLGRLHLPSVDMVSLSTFNLQTQADHWQQGEVTSRRLDFTQHGKRDLGMTWEEFFISFINSLSRMLSEIFAKPSLML